MLQMSPDVSSVGVACFIGMSAGASPQFKEADRECLIKQPLGNKKKKLPGCISVFKLFAENDRGTLTCSERIYLQP